MKPDGTNFKYMRVCQQCGNTFETNYILNLDDEPICQSCWNEIVLESERLQNERKWKELDQYMRAL